MKTVFDCPWRHRCCCLFNRNTPNTVVLTHWGRVTHICVSKLTIIGSDNGLSPGRHQAIIWTNAGILLIRTLRTNFSEILSEIRAFSFKKMDLKMSSAKWRRFCRGLHVLPMLPYVPICETESYVFVSAVNIVLWVGGIYYVTKVRHDSWIYLQLIGAP